MWPRRKISHPQVQQRRLHDLSGSQFDKYYQLPPLREHQNTALYLPTTLIQRGLMVRSDRRLSLLLLSSHSCIIVWLPPSHSFILFFLSQTGQYGQESIFIRALESVCIIHGDSSTATGTALQHRRTRRVACMGCQGETDLCWPPYPRGWIIDAQWHHGVVERLLGWLMFCVCVCVFEPDTVSGVHKCFCLWIYVELWLCACLN